MTGLLERLASVKLPEDEETLEGIPGGAVTFKLRALGHTRQSVLLVSHQPRPGNVVDKLLGYNPETYYRAIVRNCCYALTSDDETVDAPTDDAWWSALFDNLTARQFDKLLGKALSLDGDEAVPSSALDSQTSQPADESSKQPEHGESPRASSTAGSRGRSRRTNTTKPAA